MWRFPSTVWMVLLNLHLRLTSRTSWRIKGDWRSLNTVALGRCYSGRAESWYSGFSECNLWILFFFNSTWQFLAALTQSPLGYKVVRDIDLVPSILFTCQTTSPKWVTPTASRVEWASMISYHPHLEQTWENSHFTTLPPKCRMPCFLFLN